MHAARPPIPPRPGPEALLPKTLTIPSPPPGFRGTFRAPDRSDETAAGPVRLTPGAVAVPEDLNDLALLVGWAGDQGRSLVPRGAATGMPGGNVGAGILVDLASSFPGVGSADPEAGTIRVGAGAVAARVEEEAARSGLFFPPLPSSADRCTLGGMLATGAAGARSFKYGSVRDWVIELDVVLADGTAHRLTPGSPDPPVFRRLELGLETDAEGRPVGWPRVRKNSSGYALDRYLPTRDPIQLLVGSEGTLGLVTGALLRLTERPPARGLAVLGLESEEQLPGAVRAAGEIDASACEFLGRRFLEIAELADHPGVGHLAYEARILLLVEVDGAPEEVRGGLASLKEAARALGAPIRVTSDDRERESLWAVRHAASPRIADATHEGLRSTQFIEDSVVPVDHLPEYLLGLQKILEAEKTDAVVFGHAGDGNVHVNPLIDVTDPGWRERVRRILHGTADLVARLGGTLAGEHGDGRIRAPLLPKIWPDHLVAAFQRVKDALDPRGILNPGVVLPRQDQDPLEGLWREEAAGGRAPEKGSPPDGWRKSP